MLAAAAGAVAGAGALWHYNRGNFLYDRKLRQEQEFNIFEWRKVHAELWREDVRDIIELTEKKMDNYLIISVLELGMCAGLFACGRLEPGTPPWLLQLYMLTLGASFTYLIMAVWFAMHATVAAQCNSVRMLTQFVRLPIPNWHDFESARTYAHQFETLRVEDTLRVPMLRSLATGDQPSAPRLAQGPGYEDWVQEEALEDSSEASSSTGLGNSRKHPDPWRMERNGDDRGFYELRNDVPVEMRRHILLARYAAQQYQCYDAFSRLAMSFGTHQLLFAIAHFSLGYLSIQDGAHWPAWAVVIIMMCSSAMMMHVDFSLTRSEQFWATLVVFTGLTSGALSVHFWTFAGVLAEDRLSWTLPTAYAAHFTWLLCALQACGLKECPSGVLPLKFRAVLYLDVFGWLDRNPADLSILHEAETPRPAAGCCGARPPASVPEPCSEPSPSTASSDPPARGRSLLQRIFGRRAAPTRDRPQQSPLSLDAQYAPLSYQSEADFGCRGGAEASKASGAGGEIGFPPEDAFEPTTFQDPKTREDFQEMHDDEAIVTGRDKFGPTVAPARLFRRATWMFLFLWAVAFAIPLEFFKNLMAKPMVADIYVEHIDPRTGLVSQQQEVHAVVGTDVNGMPELIPVFPAPKAQLPELLGGVPLTVHWPQHSAFVPRALTCDPGARRLLVADDFGIYAARLPESFPAAAGGGADAAAGGLAAAPRDLAIRFERAPRCGALEGRPFTDAAAVCAADGSPCTALVLSGDAASITSCPFAEEAGRAENDDGLSTLRWNIVMDWLEEGELLRSVAVRSNCLHPAGGQARGGGPMSRACVIAGTSLGRVLELTASSWKNGGQLVPRKVIVQRNVASISGSLADLPASVLVALWWREGTLDILDQAGSSLGQFRLPNHTTWLMVAGGGDSLFVLGVLKEGHEQQAEANGRRLHPASHARTPHQEPGEEGHAAPASVQLWRFPVPDVVREHWRSLGRRPDGSEL